FCSMVPMRAIPADVVCLLGMDEDSFPRYSERQPLNLLLRHPEADWHPSRTDFERHIFLEALLSARSHVIVTYCNRSADGQPQGVSLLVTELLTTLERSVRGSPHPATVTHHPQLGTDPSYFGAGNCQPLGQFERGRSLCAPHSSIAIPAH